MFYLVLQTTIVFLATYFIGTLIGCLLNKLVSLLMSRETKEDRAGSASKDKKASSDSGPDSQATSTAAAASAASAAASATLIASSSQPELTTPKSKLIQETENMNAADQSENETVQIMEAQPEETRKLVEEAQEAAKKVRDESVEHEDQLPSSEDIRKPLMTSQATNFSDVNDWGNKKTVPISQMHQTGQANGTASYPDTITEKVYREAGEVEPLKSSGVNQDLVSTLPEEVVHESGLESVNGEEYAEVTIEEDVDKTAKNYSWTGYEGKPDKEESSSSSKPGERSQTPKKKSEKG